MSGLPTPGIPKPRYSGIPSTSKSGLPAPGIRARSTTGSGPGSPVAPNEPPALPQTPTSAKSTNGVTRMTPRMSNASTTPLSPDSAKPSFGLSKPRSSYARPSLPAAGTRMSMGRPPSSASATSSSRHGGDSVPATPPRRQSNAYGPGSAVKIVTTPRSSVTSRSESRLSDAFTRNSSQASQRPIEVGDFVVIESLNMNGTLRFLGEIAGKSGVWAGVELSPEYTGQGKNDGSVAGVAYFICPPKCGVFVASTKIALPSPSVVVRPGSAASSHGLASPTDTRKRKITSAEASKMAELKISAGSRASKYIGMTAKQLSHRDLASTTKGPPASPRKSSVRSSSPPRPTITTQTTPKAPRTSLSLKPRPSIPSLPALSTPRPSRAQLNTTRNNDMPPPPVPVKNDHTPILTPVSNGSSFADESFSDAVSNGPSPSPSPSQHSNRSSIYVTPSPEPTSLNTVEIQRLQNLVSSLEAKNQELQNAVVAAAATATKTDDGSKALLEQQKEALEQQKEAVSQRVSELEASLRASEKTGIEKQGKIEALERSVNTTKEDVQKARTDGEARIAEVKLKLEESEALVGNLKNLIETKTSAASENDSLLSAKQAEIEVLQGQLARTTNDLERERKELGGHVEELRQAGQETIALYEERISTFEAERYEMESLVATLEEQLKAAQYKPTPDELAKQASTAAEIDNETLREQIAHYQQRIQHLEDQLEESQAAAEREEAAVRTRLVRYKEKDTIRQQELEEARRALSSTAKSEAAARTRIEELEEALRENKTALENARAEIEGLRTDMTNLENPPTETSTDGSEEAKQLKESLDAAQNARRTAISELANAKAQVEQSKDEIKALLATIETLQQEKTELTKSLQSLPPPEAESKRSRDSTGSLMSRTKDDNLRDQVSGLKHMVQELQKENSTYNSKIRSLENENKVLTNETEDLKEAIKTLESAVDESIQKEERMLDEEKNLNEDPSSADRLLREMRLELDQVRKKLADNEKKSSRTISELNKEVADLESLIEAKIYREDDLEREVEKLKDKVQRLQSKSSKSGGERDTLKSSTRGSHTRSSTVTQQTIAQEDTSVLVCEICEQPGHDIFSCPLLKDDETTGEQNADGDLYCIDCDAHGHTAADCPHSQDVF